MDQDAGNTWSIPRIIHVIWMGESVPDRVVRLVQGCERLNPDFEVRLWRDGDLVGLQTRRFLEAEPTMSGRSDIARYEILRDIGGIYLDADFVPFKSLDVVTEIGASTGVVVARESRCVFNGAFLAAAAGHPLLTGLVDGLERTTAEFAASSPVVSLGPAYLTRSILNFVSGGGSVAELPQSWLYPYYYDRPELAEVARSSQTLLRHEWATAGGGWLPSASTEWPADAKRPFRSRVQALRTRLRPQELRTRLASVPDVHLARDIGFGLLATALSTGEPGASFRRPKRGHVSASASGSDGEQLPGPLRAGLILAVRRHIHGSATFVDLGLGMGELWRTAASRLDRPGRALRVSSVDEIATRCIPSGGRAPSRGSLGFLLADGEDVCSGGVVYSQGTPYAPRILDGSRTLDQWDRHEITWDLGSMIESCPYIDLLVISGRVGSSIWNGILTTMIRAQRVGRMIIVTNPVSTGERVDAVGQFCEEIERFAERQTCLGTLGTAGRTSWRLQIRTAQRPVGLSFSFGR